MRESDVINWPTFKQWVQERQSDQGKDFGELWFKELQEIVASGAGGCPIVHLDIEISRIPRTELAGPSKDRRRRLESYTFLHENAWKVYILIHYDQPGRKENEQYKMHAYHGAFLKDKAGKLVYFRAYDDNQGMSLWNMTGLAKQLKQFKTKE